MFQPTSKSQFSFHSFSMLSQLAHLSQSLNFTQSHNQLVNQIDKQFAKTTSNKYDHALFSFLKHKAMNVSNDPQQQVRDVSATQLGQSFKSLLNCFSQSKVKIPNQQAIVQNIHSCKLIVTDKRRLYSIKQQMTRKQLQQKHRNKNTTNLPEYKVNNNMIQNTSYRAFVVYGKAVNVEKHKKSSHVLTEQSPSHGTQSSAQDASVKQQTIGNLEFLMTRLYDEGKLPYTKSEPHQLQDILLTHYLDDSSLVPILVTHEVYRLFVPVDGAILLLIPQELIESTKPQVPSIIKNTVLHVYMDNYKVLCKTITKQSLFKSTNFRGIFFVEEGEVETKSGRVVARGWVINGKCRSTSLVCKFTKIMAFFKYVLDNQNVWKQFVNDLKLNGQWPIKVPDILNIEQNTLQQLISPQNGAFKLHSSNHRQIRLKFPPISSRLNKSFDLTKLTQIDKMKHYDEKMSHLHEFKQEMLKRKIQLGAKRASGNVESQGTEDEKDKEVNKRIHILSQKMNLPGKGLKTDVSRSLILRPGESTANILVTGIVQKLKSIHEGLERNSLQKLGSGESKRQLLEVSRSKTKILGLKRYEEVLKNEKYHLFKGKNFYH